MGGGHPQTENMRHIRNVQNIRKTGQKGPVGQGLEVGSRKVYPPQKNGKTKVDLFII